MEGGVLRRSSARSPAAATWSGVCNRPTTVAVSPITSKNSVLVGPGAKENTLTPCCLASYHKDWLKLRTKDFDAAYTASEGTG